MFFLILPVLGNIAAVAAATFVGSAAVAGIREANQEAREREYRERRRRQEAVEAEAEREARAEAEAARRRLARHKKQQRQALQARLAENSSEQQAFLEKRRRHLSGLQERLRRLQASGGDRSLAATLEKAVQQTRKEIAEGCLQADALQRSGYRIKIHSPPNSRKKAPTLGMF